MSPPIHIDHTDELQKLLQSEIPAWGRMAELLGQRTLGLAALDDGPTATAKERLRAALEDRGESLVTEILGPAVRSLDQHLPELERTAKSPAIVSQCVGQKEHEEVSRSVRTLLTFRDRLLFLQEALAGLIAPVAATPIGELDLRISRILDALYPYATFRLESTEERSPEPFWWWHRRSECNALTLAEAARTGDDPNAHIEGCDLCSRELLALRAVASAVAQSQDILARGPRQGVHPTESEFVFAALGEDAPEERQYIHEHVRICPRCAKQFAGAKRAYEETLRAFQQASQQGAGGTGGGVREASNAPSTELLLAIRAAFLGAAAPAKPVAAPPAKTRAAVYTGASASLRTSDFASLVARLATASGAQVPDLLREALTVLEETPCPWLLQSARDAVKALPSTHPAVGILGSALVPRPGRVAVLLSVDGSTLGDVWELRVTFSASPSMDPWHGAHKLQAVARDAVLSAFRFAAALMPSGLPPRPFEEHSLELVGGALNIAELDGGSVALPAALAFVSLWLDVAPMGDLAATGALRRQGNQAVVDPAGGLDQKEAALARLSSSARLLSGRSSSENSTRLGVSTLSEALKTCGLDPARAAFEHPWISCEYDRLVELRRMTTDVTVQSLGRYEVGTMDRWLVVAERLSLLLGPLEAATDPETRSAVTDARCAAALAYEHAGRADEAHAQMHGLDGWQLTGDARLLALTVALGLAIDVDDPNEQERLAAALRDGLDSPASALMTGRVNGAIGRSLMHRGRVDAALVHLRLAVAHHDSSMPWESARSRVYLAMAQRLSGDASEALKTLAEANTRLGDSARRNGPQAAAITAMFAGYEAARSLVVLGLYDDAVAACDVALARAEWLGGPWPRVGLLRTKSWALRALGHERETTACLEELRAIPTRSPILLRIQAEAEAPARSDGEVY